MKKKILLLGVAALISGNSVCAVENTTFSRNVSDQSCRFSDNKICDSITDELMKDLLKKTIYTVGTQVLNKYINSSTTVNSTPAVIPTTVVTPTTYAPVTTTTVPVTTTTPTNTATTTNTIPEEQMIIIN